MNKDAQPIQLSRRDFLRLAGLGTAGALLTACVGDLDVTANGTVDGTPVARAGNVTWNLQDTLAGGPAPEVVPTAETLTPTSTTITLHEHDENGVPGGRKVTYGPEQVQAAIDAGRIVTYAYLDTDPALPNAASFVTWSGADAAEATGWTDANDPKGLRWHMTPAQLTMSRWGYQQSGAADNTSHPFMVGLGDGEHTLNLEQVSPLFNCTPMEGGEPFNDRTRGIAVMVTHN
ncbi:MAG: twin-arginine translocation signal domain-containing protein [bacterium]|nr:twin-arginine translocation signal domain-containing protein [bacterium]